MHRYLSFFLVSLVFLSNATFANDEKVKLYKLFDEERDFFYSENPGTGPAGEETPIASKLASVSIEDQTRRLSFARSMKEKLGTINRTELSTEDQLNYDMFSFLLDRTIIFGTHKTWRIPFYSDSGFHTAPARIWTRLRFRTVEDYRAYLSQLRDLSRVFDQHIVNMRLGMQDGFTMPKIVLDGLLPTFSAPIVERAEESAFFGPFLSFAADLTNTEKSELTAMAKDVIEGAVIPAYEKLNRFMREEYYPAATSDLAASNLTGGAEYYAAMVKYYTTLDINYEEVHALGLKEVARIRAEMEEVMAEAEFEGTFAEFISFLRTDPQFYAKSEEELLMHATFIAKEIDGKMPAFFGQLPRQPYGVEPVPAAIAPNYTTGRYVGAPLDAPRGGFYWVNTYALDKRPLYNLRALTLHEAVPGHHHQSALSKELENVPEFRLGLYPNAFGEGWGLYSEKLGLDMDIYKTPYDHFGRLSYEMWRACRLVIDTGIHAKGWTREQAIQLLEDNSALSTHNIRTEVDRYISWPGQALAYKMGELKILELRARATKKLGDKFDIRAFHDRVLSAGGVPLNILEQRIDSWITDQFSD